MNTVLAVSLGVLGTIAGLVYAALGVMALKHLPSASEIDKTVGWSLWWWLERSRYTAEGQALCSKGAVVMVVAAVSWSAAVSFMQRG